MSTSRGGRSGPPMLGKAALGPSEVGGSAFSGLGSLTRGPGAAAQARGLHRFSCWPLPCNSLNPTARQPQACPARPARVLARTRTCWTCSSRGRGAISWAPRPTLTSSARARASTRAARRWLRRCRGLGWLRGRLGCLMQHWGRYIMARALRLRPLRTHSRCLRPSRRATPLSWAQRWGEVAGGLGYCATVCLSDI